MPAFPPRASLFPVGDLSPASFKALLADWYDAITGLVGTGGTQAEARNNLGFGVLSFRNKVVNGGFDIDQRNEGAAASVSSSTAVFGPDRWAGVGTGSAGVFSLQRVSDATRPGKYRLKVAVTTADASLAAGDLYVVRQRLLGSDVRDWNLGTSSAKEITVSFEIESEVAGNYGIRLTNKAANRSYVGLVTVNSANTRETKHVTLTLDQSGTWVTGLDTGLEFALCLAAGTTYQTTAGSWQAGNFYTTSGQTNFMGTIGNDLYLADVQIEEGEITSRIFEEIPQSELEQRCRFFYRKSFARGTAPATGAGIGGSHTITQCVATSTLQTGHRIPFDQPMGSAPTVTTYNPVVSGSELRNLTTGANSTGAAATGDANGIYVDFTTAGGSSVAGNTWALHWTASWEP